MLKGWFEKVRNTLPEDFSLSDRGFQDFINAAIAESEPKEPVREWRQLSLMDYVFYNWNELQLEQTFKGSHKTITLQLESIMTSGTIDDKILGNRETTGFVYRLNAPGVSSKGMYVLLPDVVEYLESGYWVDKSGLFQQQQKRIELRR